MFISRLNKSSRPAGTLRNYDLSGDAVTPTDDVISQGLAPLHICSFVALNSLINSWIL